MSDGIKETTTAILSNPKVAALVAAPSIFQIWWLEWGSWLLDAGAGIAGFILVVVLIRLHIENFKKIRRENEEYEASKANKDDS